MMTMDNGKEFVGKMFQNVLVEYGIKVHRIHPGNPEENAKIERFWSTLEGAIVDRSNIEAVVNEYNTKWPHRGLREILGRSCTPEEAWQTEPHYEGKSNLGFDYY
jgi:transposase InsO family protein